MGKWFLIILYLAKLSLKNEGKYIGLWEQKGQPFSSHREEWNRGRHHRSGAEFSRCEWGWIFQEESPGYLEWLVGIQEMKPRWQWGWCGGWSEWFRGLRLEVVFFPREPVSCLPGALLSSHLASCYALPQLS